MRPPDRHPGGGLVWLLVAGALLLAPHLGPTSAPAQAPPGTRAATASAPAGSGMAARAVAYAVAQVGQPYAWGAEGPGAFDCSGLTWAAWRHAGLGWPRLTAADQWHALRGHAVNRQGLRPGDLVFYADNRADWRTIHHVGLYAGAGRIIEAPFSGALVRYAPVDRPGWFGTARPVGGGRW